MTIEELRRLYEAATPGEWEQGQLYNIGIYVGKVATHERMSIAQAYKLPDPYQAPANAALIVAMHNALPALLDVVEAARKYGYLQDYLDRLDADSQWGDNEGDADYREHLRAHIKQTRAALSALTGKEATDATK